VFHVCVRVYRYSGIDALLTRFFMNYGAI